MGYATSDLPRVSSANEKQAVGKRSNFSASQTTYTTVHHHLYLDPTAVASGYKKGILKVRQDHIGQTDNGTSLRQEGLLLIFDPVSDLPAGKVFPTLLDAFFKYYGGNFCHLHYKHLDWLVERGQAPFLISVMSALSSRFCAPALFSDFFRSAADGHQERHWSSQSHSWTEPKH